MLPLLFALAVLAAMFVSLLYRQIDLRHLKRAMLDGASDGQINFGAFPGIHTLNLNADLTLHSAQPSVGFGGGNAVPALEPT